MQYYAVMIDKKTYLLTSQSVLPIDEETANNLRILIANNAPEEIIADELLTYMGG